MTSDRVELPLRQRPVLPARRMTSPPSQWHERRLAEAAGALNEPFKGITTDGIIIPDLFTLDGIGVSSDRVHHAGQRVRGLLTRGQRAEVAFPIDSDAWRQWYNPHPFLLRHGVSLDEMSGALRDSVLDLLASALSPRGYAAARGVMQLNHHVGELTGRWDEYGEWLYWFSLFGEPEPSEPWGWQLDGHHLIVNCFVLNDQIVLTPMFLGSEPVNADCGRYAGIRLFEEEESRGLEFRRSLDPVQAASATIGENLPIEVVAGAFQDNLILPYAGIRADRLNESQRRALLGLIDVYVSRAMSGHASLRLDEARRHLDDTYFGWIGGVADSDVFYYRIHSPVVLIEFDHQRGIAFDFDGPNRHHIHTLVRTPNGNDYGRDFLRQHYEQHPHPPA